MSTRLKELLETRAKLHADSCKILDLAESEKREPTTEELAEWDRMDAGIASASEEIDRRERQDKRSAFLAEPRGRITEPVAPSPGGLTDPEPVAKSMTIDMGNGHKVQFNPDTSEFARCQDAYSDAFASYCAYGVTPAVHAGLQTSPDIKGGYLAPMNFMAELIQALDDAVVMRQLARVLPPISTGVSLGTPSLDTDPADADWTAEVPASDISEDDAMRFGARELMPHLLTKLIKVSEKLLRASALSVEAIVRERMAYKFAITEEKAFLTGDGAQQPLGVFVASDDGIASGRDTTAASTTVFTADELMDALYSLKPQYQNRATWLFHRQTLKRIRQLKDGNGQYLWQPGIAGGEPSTVLARPYVQSENAPSTYTAGLYVAIVGDFQTGYWIVDALSMTIQRLAELFALKNQVGFKGAKETDGMPVLSEAFARLKLAAS